MAKPLTYLTLNCVIEYLEANKRIHIAARCPALRKIERKLPLRLDHLNLDCTSIILNEITYQLCTVYSVRVGGRIDGGKYELRAVPHGLNQDGRYDHLADTIIFDGDIPLKSPDGLRRETLETGNEKRNAQQFPINLYFGYNILPYCPIHLDVKNVLRQKIHNNRVPNHLEFHVAMKHLTNFLLGSRPAIIVKLLKVVRYGMQKVLRLPVDLNLKVQELETTVGDHLRYLTPLISHFKSLKLALCSWNSACFNLPILRNAKKLTLSGFYYPNPLWCDILLRFPNQNIILELQTFTKGELILLVRRLLAAWKEIGTYYRIEFRQVDLISVMIEELGQTFGRKIITETNGERNHESYYLIPIPINSTSELSINGSSSGGKCHIEIKVVPKPKPLSWNSVKYVLEYFEENRRICLTTQCPNLHGIESTGPLRLDYLSLGYSSITMNDITYQLYTLKDNKQYSYALNKNGNQNLSAGKVQMLDDLRIDTDSHDSPRSPQGKFDDRKTYPVCIGFKKYDSEELTISRQVPNNLEFHVAMRLLTSSLFGGRPEIRVKRLEVQTRSEEILRIALSLKLQVQELIAKQNIIEFVYPIIDDRSFPLKKLTMRKAIWVHPAFQLPVVQNAQNLEILGGGLYFSNCWDQKLQELPNRQIDLKCGFVRPASFVNYIQNLMDTGRDIGTIYTIDYAVTGSYIKMLHDIEKKYNRVAEIKKVDSNESVLPITTFSITLPMSSTSEVVISGTAHHIYCAIKMEVVPFVQETPKVIT